MHADFIMIVAKKCGIKLEEIIAEAGGDLDK